MQQKQLVKLHKCIILQALNFPAEKRPRHPIVKSSMQKQFRCCKPLLGY